MHKCVFTITVALVVAARIIIALPVNEPGSCLMPHKKMDIISFSE